MNTSLKGLNELDESEICQVSGGAAGDLLYGVTDLLAASPANISQVLTDVITMTDPLIAGFTGTVDSATSQVNTITGSIIP